MRIKLPQTHAVLSVFSYSSLTDIVLLLLIFFLLTSSFIATKGLTVKLPEAANAKTTDPGIVTVTLHRDGSIDVNGALSSIDSLRGDLGRMLPDPEKQVVVLQADKDVPFDRAVRVMDEARGLGVASWHIATQDREQ